MGHFSTVMQVTITWCDKMGPECQYDDQNDLILFHWAQEFSEEIKYNKKLEPLEDQVYLEHQEPFKNTTEVHPLLERLVGK